MSSNENDLQTRVENLEKAQEVHAAATAGAHATHAAAQAGMAAAVTAGGAGLVAGMLLGVLVARS